MSTDRHIGSDDSVPEVWVSHSDDSLPETWAPELQCHGGIGGSAWSLFLERITGASNEHDVHGQTICRPRASHAIRGRLGREVAVNHGRSCYGQLPPTNFSGDGNHFGGEGNSIHIGQGRNRDSSNLAGRSLGAGRLRDNAQRQQQPAEDSRPCKNEDAAWKLGKTCCSNG